MRSIAPPVRIFLSSVVFLATAAIAQDGVTITTLEDAERAAWITNYALRNMSQQNRAQLEASIPKSEDPHLRRMEFLHGLQMLDRRNGYALDWHGYLHRTSDGGVTWSELPLPALKQSQTAAERVPDSLAYRALSFSDVDYGMVVGGLGAFQTLTGGSLWEPLNDPPLRLLSAVACTAARTCWVGGTAGRIWKLEFGGASWLPQPTPAKGNLAALRFVDEKNGWGVTDAGEIIATGDGGRRWSLQFRDKSHQFWGLYLHNSKTGWALAGDGRYVKTRDGGKTWTRWQLPKFAEIPFGQMRLHAAAFKDENVGWIGGLHGMIFATRDGGQTWSLSRFEGVSANMLTIWAMDRRDGVLWAAGNLGNIFASTSEGAFWFPVHGLMFQWVMAIRNTLTVNVIANAANAYTMFRAEHEFAQDNGWDAVERLRPLAEAGDAQAQAMMGDMFYRGSANLLKEFRLAAFWYRKAAENGHSGGQRRLADLLEYGEGVDANLSEALKWRTLSATQGDPRGQSALGDMYWLGRGVDRDDEEALKWYRLAAAQNNAWAWYRLGEAYDLGAGVPQDGQKAQYWYLQAADEGVTNAQFQLGKLLFEGRGVKKDPEKAAGWFRKAAGKGSADAQLALGLRYVDGSGVKANNETAYFWLSLAERNGRAEGRAARAKAGSALKPETRRKIDERVSSWSPGGEAP